MLDNFKISSMGVKWRIPDLVGYIQIYSADFRVSQICLEYYTEGDVTYEK